MPAPPKVYTEGELQEALAAYEQTGSINAAARLLNENRMTFKRKLRRAWAESNEDPAIRDARTAVGTNMTPRLAWAKTKNENGTSYSVLLKPDTLDDDLVDRIREAVEGIEPAAPVAPPEYVMEDMASVYLLADVHIGMMAWGQETGEDYSTKKAAARVKEWVARCVAASPPAETAVILDVGDYTHANDATNMTQRSRHVLDVDTRHFRTMDLAIDALGAAIECALTKHRKVIVRILPGNHNPDAYLCVLFAIAERYRNEPRVEVQKVPGEFFIFQFGEVMIAAHHGDKAKASQIVHFVADEYAKIWGQTRHRFLFTGHLHHHKSQDIGGMKWEQLRAVTARDNFASSHAFSARAQMQAITFHRKHGEAQRVSVAA